METIRGAFLRFLSPPGKGDRESGFAVVRYESSGQLVEAKVSGPFSPMIQENEWIVAEGDWRENSYKGRHELIFRARTIHPDLPATKVGAAQLFTKTFRPDVHGIGKDSILRFVERHGAAAALKAEKDPRILLEMSSDPEGASAAIFRDWSRRISGRVPIRLMEDAGCGDDAVKAVMRRHRDAAMRVIERNPYDLASIPGVGFRQADLIGRKMGVPLDDPRRVAAAVVDAVSSDDGAGHTWMPLSDLRGGLERNDVDAAALKGLIAGGGAGTDLVFDRENGIPIAQRRPLYASERHVAVTVARMLGREEPGRASHVARVTERVLAHEKYSRFDEVQKAAVAMAAKESFSVLTGGPGTGKSTVTEAIAEIAAEVSPGPVILMAPTGKAARRLEETTGRPASTVHKALEATGHDGSIRFGRGRYNPLPAGCFVVVDEASMLDVETASALLDAIPEDGRVLFVGDKNQLPSVGPGYVLGDLIAARGPGGAKVPCAELVNVYRNRKGSSIAHGAAHIRDGVLDTSVLDNVMRGGVMLYDLASSAITDHVVNLMLKAIPNSLKLDPMRDVAVLCPQRSGAAGTWEMNAALSRALNPKGRAIEGMPRPAGDDARMPLPRVGDRVMMTRNDYDNDVMNGDVGTIVDAFVDMKTARKERKVRVKFDAGQTVDLPVSRCRDLVLAYAITGHKSQGSQYPCVVMPLSSDHAGMLDRTLVYTEWTRAQDYLILVGEEEVLAAGVSKTDSAARRTRLRTFLEHTLGQAPRSADDAGQARRPPPRPMAGRPSFPPPPRRPPPPPPPVAPAQDEAPRPRF